MDKFLTQAEVAEMLHRTPRTLKAWAYEGSGPLAMKLEGRWLYPRSDFDAYLRAAREEALGRRATAMT